MATRTPPITNSAERFLAQLIPLGAVYQGHWFKSPQELEVGYVTPENGAVVVTWAAVSWREGG